MYEVTCPISEEVDRQDKDLNIRPRTVKLLLVWYKSDGVWPKLQLPLQQADRRKQRKSYTTLVSDIYIYLDMYIYLYINIDIYLYIDIYI